MTGLRSPLLGKALRLEYFTIAWNLVEAAVAVAAGVTAGSIALIGFGFDSSIEAFAASVVIWQLLGDQSGREKRALKLIALSFFVLAAYVIFESGRDLIMRSDPESSSVGIALAIASLVVMPALWWGKRQLAARMGSEVLRADAAETLLCAWLSLILLIGLVLNATLGWWWADPLAALGIAWLALREGLETWATGGE